MEEDGLHFLILMYYKRIGMVSTKDNIVIGANFEGLFDQKVKVKNGIII